MEFNSCLGLAALTYGTSRRPGLKGGACLHGIWASLIIELSLCPNPEPHPAEKNRLRLQRLYRAVAYLPFRSYRTEDSNSSQYVRITNFDVMHLLLSLHDVLHPSAALPKINVLLENSILISVLFSISISAARET
ncbi:hypothetical protein CVT26_006698 [Gymnopilus dilepis]|uniref:Uncharacterized protein n=1 Tax=Gymnopilus dilepis TaxID=231916 RepID=A0A409WQC3_9AGAR|nr:hypothetical protein CVT26_006698 [Gymnopilus dilepis]